MTELKHKIKEHYRNLLLEKREQLRLRLESLEESLLQETKSTAGDKYETGRAMVHIEQGQVQQQYHALNRDLAELESLDTGKGGAKVAQGSLVGTGDAWFYLSVALGKAIVEGNTVYALSPRSPLGQKLMGSTTGDTILMNGKKYTLKYVC